MELENDEQHRSLLALDSTNFFLADVETGIGPFVATFLSSQRHWNSSQIGIVTGAQNLGAVLAQAPAGWWIDASTHKRWLVAGAAAVLSLGSLFVTLGGGVSLQLLNQFFIGAALAVLLPCISAISLGIVGKDRLSPRIGRNAMFTHIGNTLTAALAGYLSFRNGERWIFYVSAVLGIAAIASVLLIRKRDINDEVARAKDEKADAQPVPVSRLFQDGLTLRFLALVVIFHIVNSSMLPLAGQEMAKAVHGKAETYMAACIVVGQLVMAAVAFAAGKLADGIGRKPLFLIGFVALLLRGLLFACFHAPEAIVAIEALDGVATAIAGVTTVLIISDLTKGTGRFNLLQGVAQAALGVGAFAGKISSGWLAKATGYPVTFLSLAGVAAAGLLAYFFLVQETGKRTAPA